MRLPEGILSRLGEARRRYRAPCQRIRRPPTINKLRLVKNVPKEKRDPPLVQLGESPAINTTQATQEARLLGRRQDRRRIKLQGVNLSERSDHRAFRIRRCRRLARKNLAPTRPTHPCILRKNYKRLACSALYLA